MTTPTWTAEQIAELTRLVTEGHSYAEIGRLMGLSKGACVSKSHRLFLPARPSPIKPKPGTVCKNSPEYAAARKIERQQQEVADKIAAARIKGSCQYLEGEKTGKHWQATNFCGKPATHVAYCEYHSQLCTGTLPLKTQELVFGAKRTGISK